MDLTVVTYLLYLAVVLPLTLWVGRALSRHGQAFLVDVFYGDERLASAVNQLLVIGFYLLNFGYLSFFMSTSDEVDDARHVMEVVATKAGGVALVVGAVHFANLWCLNALRRRALLRARATPPVAPDGYMTITAAPTTATATTAPTTPATTAPAPAAAPRAHVPPVAPPA
jgi:hypothetical protein